MVRTVRQTARAALGLLPRPLRFAVVRRLIDIELEPDARLAVRIADSREDLEACFRLLHDAYVHAGYMQPHPSGLRVTPWHALPTTTTIAATWDGEVVGTLSLIRDGVFGFPLQSAFDLSPLRDRPGHIAEVSALAVHPAWRRTGGRVLFPLMKFMYEYCTSFFDTRHLVIAVNPATIELYEALLLFRRLQDRVVDRYGFANGAPAVGATLDLADAAARFEEMYGGRAATRDLHHYFVERRLPHLHLPARPLFTTNDPVMTPGLLDHFFNRRTQVFESLDERQRVLLHAIYADEATRAVLPPLGPESGRREALRRHPRHSIKCPSRLNLGGTVLPALVVELSRGGLMLMADRPLPIGAQGLLEAHLGRGLHARVEVRIVRRDSAAASGHFYGLQVESPDSAWLDCAARLEGSRTHDELVRTATRPWRVPVEPVPA